MQNQPKIEYLECPKEGFHFGENLNMVCMQQTCLDNLVCCCACIEQDHKSHTTKPLKIIMNEAKKKADLIKPIKFNLDNMLKLIKEQHNKSMEVFKKHKKQIITNLEVMESSLNGYYELISQQVKLKNSDPKQEIEKAFGAIYNPGSVSSLKEAVKRIAAMLPTKEDDDLTEGLTEAELIDSIHNSNQEINTIITKNIDSLNKQLNQHQLQFQAQANPTNIWKSTTFKFSPTFKHADVKIITDQLVKSTNNSGYKFAIMEPNLEKGAKIKNFAFKIKQSSSNWVAVGVCHKKIVVSKSYGFNFSSLGHGAYMVSANGGSWNNSKLQENNSVKAFKFIKGDTIAITMNMDTKVLQFKKNAENYTIHFDTIIGDELHPCVLFYYINDEIEFLNNFKG